jgi:hypothetical protein
VALKYSPVSRNLHNPVYFFGLEIEDIMVVGVACVVAMLAGQFFFSDRYLLVLPMNWALAILVLMVGLPALTLFKYGKPRSYMKDLIAWYTRPRAYAACERDDEFPAEYVVEEEE